MSLITLPAVYCRRSVTLDRLRAERQQCVDFVQRTLDEVETKKRDLSDTEQEALERQKGRLRELDAQIKPLADFEALVEADRSAANSYRPSVPAPTGDSGSGQAAGGGQFRTEPRAHEYKTRGQVVVDQIMLRTGQFEMAGTKTSVSEEMAQRAKDRLMGAGLAFPGMSDEYAKRIVNNVTGDMPGLLPKPIIGAVDNNLDAARPFISSIGGAKDMSDIPGKVFTRPVITSHTTSAKQTTEKSELASSKLVIGGVDFTKETHGGTVDVARQLIDWSSPSAWDALLGDLQDAYAIDTETSTVAAFATAVTATVANAAAETPTGWATPLYAAAAAVYAGCGRLPNMIWTSLDQWQRLGVAIDAVRATGANNDRMGKGSPAAFEGVVFDLPRTVVPSLPAKSVIIGVREKTEFYEQRVGLLTAVEPRLLGVEIAYGGYCAFGTLRPAAFAKLNIP